MRKQLSFILIAVMMVLLLTGFVGSESGSNKESLGSGIPGSSESGVKSGELLSGRERNSQEGLLEAVMLYGHYSNQYFTTIGVADEKINQSLENLKFEERDSYPGESISEKVSLTAVPVSISAARLADNFNFSKGYDLAADTEWQRIYADLGKELPGKQDEYLSKIRTLYNTNYIKMTYADENSEPANYKFEYTYTIEGNTLHCKRIQSFNEDLTITYCEPEIVEDYQVSFRGDSMTIERNGCVGTLLSLKKQILADAADEEYDFLLYGGIDRTENAFQDIRSIFINWKGSRTKASSTTLYFVDGTRTSNAAAVQEEPNKVTVSWDKVYDAKSIEQDAPGKVTFQYLSADDTILGVRGFILLDDAGKVYPYIYDDQTFMLNTAGDNLENTEAAEKMDEDTQARIIEEKNTVVSAMKDSFEESEIKAEMDEQSGTVRFDTNIVFDVNSAEIADAGKSELDEFLKAYIPIMQEQVQKGNIAKVQIDGHTDTNGDHEYNQDLSERRAQAVADYIIASYPEIEPYLVTKGYSFDKPVLAEDGSVDMAASRRVEFRFILDTD